MVQIEISKINDKKQEKLKESNKQRQQLAEYNNSSKQELYELTERKFLKQIVQFCDQMITNKTHPRLFYIDLINTDLIDSIERKKKIPLMNLMKLNLYVSNCCVKVKKAGIQCNHFFSFTTIFQIYILLISLE